MPNRPALVAKEVIWIATSNIAHEMMFEKEIGYEQLKTAVRNRVSEHLGVSILG